MKIHIATGILKKSNLEGVEERQTPSGKFDEMFFTLVIPSPIPGEAGYKVLNESGPEFASAYSDILNIPTKIEMAISEYDALSVRSEMVQQEFISQVKLK